jgi:hypothetical protein
MNICLSRMLGAKPLFKSPDGKSKLSRTPDTEKEGAMVVVCQPEHGATNSGNSGNRDPNGKSNWRSRPAILKSPTSTPVSKPPLAIVPVLEQPTSMAHMAPGVLVRKVYSCPENPENPEEL